MNPKYIWTAAHLEEEDSNDWTDEEYSEPFSATSTGAFESERPNALGTLIDTSTEEGVK